MDGGDINPTVTYGSIRRRVAKLYEVSLFDADRWMWKANRGFEGLAPAVYFLMGHGVLIDEALTRAEEKKMT